MTNSTISMQGLTIEKAQQLLSSGDITSVDLVTHYLDVIQKKDTDINAYREVFADCLAAAEAADALRADIKAKHGGDTKAWIAIKPLLGMPISVKDTILVKGHIAGASSKMLEDYIAPYDATVIAKLKDAGAIFIGRVNMDEFAMGGSTENSAYGVTKNPYDLEKVAGGSSGGSIASVAMDGALASLGSDTGGSIRQPAAYCGVVGLKPTYGSVSRHGLMAMGSSLDVIGPVTRTITDAKIMFDVIKGKDSYDATSHDNLMHSGIDMTALSGGQSALVSKIKSRTLEAKDIVVGVVPTLMSIGGIDTVVIKAFENTISYLKSQGIQVREIELPRISYSLATYYVIMPAEVSSNMGRFDGMRYGSKVKGDTLLAEYMNTRGQKLGKEVRRRIMLGAYVLSVGYYDAYYNKAQMVREMLKEDFAHAFKQVDVILTPTAPSPAFKIGANTSDPIKMYLEDVFTVPANLVGIPALSVPVGWTSDQKPLPLAVQCMAAHGMEEVLFAIGHAIEKMKTV
jgi:aspartyl-tRNA(Asn)/glutamyl-tRNA(Gln) amidotransferase subunit A